jgi:hypothetical protein
MSYVCILFNFFFLIWYNSSIGMIILNVQYNFMASFMEGILNISDTYMLAKILEVIYKFIYV